MVPVRQPSVDTFPDYPLTELHAHLGASIDPAVLWRIAHTLGFKLPKKEYREFCEFVTLSPERPMPLNEYFDKIYHPILDKLSSGTHAVEEAAYQTISGGYRANGITTMELRTNPMKHNMKAEVDLDHLIMAMLRGMERALLEHKKLSAGLIFCIAREYSFDQNRIIVEKAIKYRRRGVVGIDVAGPASPGFHPKDYEALFDKARQAGLGITAHSGEVSQANDMADIIRYLRPQRIGHGILAAADPAIMRQLAEKHIVLEVCPLSNLATDAVKSPDDLRRIFDTFIKYGVPFTINTDWPEIIEGCRLGNEYRWLRDSDLLTDAQLRRCTNIAAAASFIPKPGGLNAYL